MNGIVKREETNWCICTSSNCTISGTSTTNGGGIVVSNALEIVGNNTI